MNTTFNSESREYFPEIDICRGIGIILVVFGHALKQTGEMNKVFDIALSVIYSFHMPLFFLLSGFVSIKALRFCAWNDQKRYIKERAFRLLLPYFSIGLLYLPLKYFLSRYAVQPYDFSAAWKILLGDNPNTALWFVYILFIIEAVCVLAINSNNMTAFLGLSFILTIMAYGTNCSLRFPKYLFFFILGIYLRMNYKKWILLLNKTTTFFCSLTIFILSNIILYTSQVQGITVISALSGIICCICCSLKILETGGSVLSLLKLFGTYSMDIYILSEPFNTTAKIICWSVLGLNYLVCTFCCFISALLLPIPVSKYIVRRIRIFRMLILGTR